eukprot:gene22145-29207_t
MGSRQKKHGKFAVSIEDDSDGEIELNQQTRLFDVVPEDITSQGWDAYQDQLDNPCFSFASVELDDTSHGQACFCVPDFSADEHGEYAGITVESMVHVYRVALQFAHGEGTALAPELLAKPDGGGISAIWTARLASARLSQMERMYR